MARPLRIDRPGGWYHVNARGNERKSIFSDDRDRRHFQSCRPKWFRVLQYGRAPLS
jgi:hypothetical protein